MAVFESDRRAFEAKAQLGTHDHHVEMDISSHETPLQNGHNFKESFESPSSVNTSAHQNNLEIESHDFAPMTNGVTHHYEQDLNSAITSVEPSSDLPSSGETGDTHLQSSSQSMPDDSISHSEVKLDEVPLALGPAVVQQQTSDVREEAQTANVVQVPESEELEQRQETSREPELPSKVVPSLTQTESTIVDLQSGTDLPPPPDDTQISDSHSIETLNVSKPTEDTTTTTQTSLQNSTSPPAGLPDQLSVQIQEGVTTETPQDPPPSPSKPVETSVTELKPEIKNDQVMADEPPSPAKIAREREDDDLEDGPAAKRSKTGNEPSPDFKVPDRPAINTQVNGDQNEDPVKEPKPITPAQHKALGRVMANVKRVQAATHFRQPVDIVALNIPSYPTFVTNPMDLRTLEENLKAGKYSSLDAFVADFNQIVENTRIFNGPEHGITKQAISMKDSFDKQMEKIPGPEVVDSSQADKNRKSIVPQAAKVSAPRRESRSSLPGSARSPVSAASTPTFALGPQGVPTIRRDSTLGDGGRPKREIHPPAPRDLPYANQKPRKKKYQYELKFCDQILKELSKPKYQGYTSPFMVPVDPVALNIPTYHSVIKKPMDFGTMRTKLDRGEYENAKEFEADARQIFQNCYKFNKQGDWVYATGKTLEGIFDSEWAKKREWIDQNTPASGAQSPGSSEAEDSDEEEDEAEEEDEEAVQLSKLQQQIAQMSRQVEMITQKKKSPPVSSKKAAKGAKVPRKDTKKSAAPARVEKKTASKHTKKAPYVTYEQKQDISNRINALSETKMATALNIIRDSMPTLKGVQDDELELDIDELSDEVLHKLLVFVRKHVPHKDDSPARPPPPTSSSAPTRKKNKPMSKHEQEARIAQVQSGLSAFQNPGSAPVYDEPGPDQESSDGATSSESEEE